MVEEACWAAQLGGISQVMDSVGSLGDPPQEGPYGWSDGCLFGVYCCTQGRNLQVDEGALGGDAGGAEEEVL